MEDDESYDSAFKTFDASDYSSIATIETKRAVLGLSTSSNDLQIAVVENTLFPANNGSEESVVRLYDVGRHRAEDEDLEDGDEDDEDDDEGGGGGDDEEEDDLGLGDLDDDDDEEDDDDDDDDDEDDENEDKGGADN